MIKSNYTGLRHGPINSFIRQDNLLQLNPFVMWDHFQLNSTQTEAGFDFHGHSGIAAVTYVIDADLTHEDSKGNVVKLPRGSVQLLVAGAGAQHKETLTSEDGNFEAFQLWTALPKNIEMSEASYQGVSVEDLPVIKQQNTSTKILVGEYADIKSPIKHVIDMNYFHITMAATKAHWRYSASQDQNSRFIYVLQGNISIFGEPLTTQQLVLIDNDNVSELEITADSDDSQFLFISATSLAQSILPTGPSVHSSYENSKIGHQNIQQLFHKMMK
ncbi:pirin family protein [Photobacterium kishitanii]|uniref:pirin family protein n=1 Tax=Photobacterium kishitanii TaxID=318456 RepID=UPI00071AEC75|nr:pirin family protein [Photobacterium kishitanii]